MAEISKMKDRKTDTLYDIKDAQARAVLPTKQDKIESVSVDYEENGGNPDVSAEFEDGNLGFTMQNMKMKFSDLTEQEKEELKGEKGDQGDCAVYDPSSPDTPDFVMASTTGQSTTKAMTQKAVTDELDKVKNGLNIAFENWEEVEAPEDVTLYEGNLSSEKGITYAEKPVNNGDKLRITTEGSGSLLLYVYWTTSTNPKTAIASLSGNQTKEVTFSLGAYQSYHRLLLYMTSGSTHVKLEKLAPEAKEFAFTETMNSKIRELIEESKEDEPEPEEETENPLGDIVLLKENTTDKLSIQRTNAKLNTFEVGDYIKIVVGEGTVGTWYFCTYLTASTNPKNIYNLTLAPNKTYYYKIYNDFYKLYFEKNDSCDAPISVYVLNKVEKDILDMKAQDIDYSQYYNKGEANKSFTKKPLIIVAGQSNAEGRVPVADLPEEYVLSEPDSNVHVYNGSGFSNLSTGYFSQSRWAFDFITWHYISQVKECYVVKHAKGATRLNAHTGGSDEAWSADFEILGTSLLRQLENKIRNAKTLSDDINIRAILWHQGEGDFNWGDEQKYYINLKKLIAYLRGVCGDARLPFISGTISHLSGQYSKVVEEAQLRVASEDKYVTYIDMSGATLLDEYHFDATSSEYLGKMMYNTLIDYGVISGEKLAVECPWEE